MNKNQQIQALIRHYKEITGEKEIEMPKVVEFAVAHGWKLPQPKTPQEILAKEFSEAAREETRRDGKTGRVYRVNHAITGGKGQSTFWVDIDEAPRKHMHKSAVQRREQMVGDGLQLTLDLDHWNHKNPSEEPIVLPMDLTPDIEWRKNVSEEDEKTG
jgi:hypothetical protein